jgi:ABC-2 type transport system permease protein
VVRQTLALTGRELKHWYRSRMQIAMALIQPLMWLGLFGLAMSSFTQSMGVDYFSFLAMGMVIITALSTSMNSGMSVIWDRRFGFLNKLKAAPIPRGLIPLSKVLSTTVKATVQSLLVLLVGLALGLQLQVGFGILDVLVIVAAVIMTALIFSSLFVTMGLVIDNQETIMGLNMLLNLPLMFASGAMFPIAGLPGWLQTVAKFNPLTYAADAVRRAAMEWDPILMASGSMGQDLLILAIAALVMTVTGMALANRALKA